MNRSPDEQAVRVAGLLRAPHGQSDRTVQRFGATDAWLVSLGDERLVLKRGRSEQDDADVAWEHDHLSRLARTGFPASIPLPAFDGQTWVRSDGRIWGALSFLPGWPLVSEADPDFAAAGAFLARYHRAAASLPRSAHRPTETGLWRLRQVTPWERLAPALGDDAAVDRFGALLEDLEAGLNTLRYDTLDHLVIHGDPTNDNVIVEDIAENLPPRIVGLIDFGSAHLAPATADIAAAMWRSGRPDPGGVAYDCNRIGRYVAGYHLESTLPMNLARAIPLLMQGRGLQLISRRVRRLSPDRPVPLIPDTRLTLARTEWLHAHRPALTAAIERAQVGLARRGRQNG